METIDFNEVIKQNIEVVGGLLGGVTKEKSGLMTPYIYNSLFTVSGYQNGYFRIKIDTTNTYSWALRVTVLGICEYEIYRNSNNSNDVLAYFLSKQNSGASASVWSDTDTGYIYISASSGLTTISTLYSNSIYKDLVLDSSFVSEVPSTAVKISVI